VQHVENLLLLHTDVELVEQREPQPGVLVQLLTVACDQLQLRFVGAQLTGRQ
jgi:hypothetical protein